MISYGLTRCGDGGRWDVAQTTLRELFPSNIKLEADSSGKFLWATFAYDEYASRLALLHDTHEQRLDADTKATLAAFARQEAADRVENSGSGGRIRSLLASIPRRKVR